MKAGKWFVLSLTLLLVVGLTAQVNADPTGGRLYWTSFGGVHTAPFGQDPAANIALGPAFSLFGGGFVDGAVFAPGGASILGGVGDHIISVPTFGGPPTNVSAPGANQVAHHLALDPGGVKVWSASTFGPHPNIIEETNLATGIVTPHGVFLDSDFDGLPDDFDGDGFLDTPVPVSGLAFGVGLFVITDDAGTLYVLNPANFSASVRIGGLPGSHQVLFDPYSFGSFIVMGFGGVLTQIDPVTWTVRGALALPAGFIDNGASDGLGHLYFTDPNAGALTAVDLTGTPPPHSLFDPGVVVGPPHGMPFGIDDVLPLVGPGGPEHGPRVLTDPNKVNFGDVQTGTEGHGDVHIVNIGDAPLTVLGNSLPQGDQAGFFDVFFGVPLPVVLQPGEELVVHTKFRPQDQKFYQSFFDVFTDDRNYPQVSVRLCGNGVFPPTMLHFEEAFGRPGGHAVTDVILDSPLCVKGIQFRIKPNPPWQAHFNGAVSDLSPDFTVIAGTDPDGTTTVLMFSTTEAWIPSDHHRILELVWDIDPNTPPGGWINLDTWDVILSDQDGNGIPFQLWPGMIHTGHPGDDDLDGRITVLDIIKEVKIILGRAPHPRGFDLFLADANGDGGVDIRDIVWKVRVILDQGGQPKPIVGEPASPVTVSLADVQALASGQLAIPVTMNTDDVIAGAQATFTFDASQLQLGTPQLVGRADGMTVESHLTDGKLQVIVYSVTGQGIGAGSGPTLLIPATLIGGPNTDPTLTLADVVLANRQAQGVPVVLGTSTVKVAPLPTAFALKGARPNPFNPTTRLAYDVPKQAHVVLAVYNLLGQEVIRLVDAEQQPGRYELVWNGRNAQGLSVASGVYLYRLTSSTGFSQTKRMTLLK